MKVYRCECSTEVLAVDFDPEFEDDINFAVYSYGKYAYGNMSRKDRIRWCWKILRTGKAWNDEIVLKGMTVIELIKDLKEMVKKYDV